MWLRSLASPVGIRVTGAALLSLDGHTILQGFQNPARSAHDFFSRPETTGDFYVGLSSNASGDLDKLHFVGFYQVNALNAFRLFTDRRWRWHASSYGSSRR